MNLFKKRKKRGFTLVELVVTIAIMLAIVTIAVPSAISLSNRSKQKSRELQIKEFESAAESYVLDNKNKWNVANIGSSSNYCFTLSDLLASQYIKEIPEDPTTNSEFTGSVNISVETVEGVELLKYEYSENTCGNRIVDAELTEIMDYDDALEIDNTTSTGGSYEGEVIAGLYDNNIKVTTGTYKNPNIEPGIRCESINGGTDNFCSFVGPVNNNYVKIEGMTYKEDVDYTNQTGNDILWRVVSFDRTNNNVKLISDAGVTSSAYNIGKGEYTHSTLTSIKELTKASDAELYNLKTSYKGKYNSFDSLSSGYLDAALGNNFRHLGSIKYNNRNDSELDLFNTTIASKHYDMYEGKFLRDNDSFEPSEYRKIFSSAFSRLSSNHVQFFAKSAITSSYAYPVDKIISVKKISDSEYYVNEITPKSTTNNDSEALSTIKDWFNSNKYGDTKYSDLKQETNPIFKESEYCSTSYGSASLSSSNNIRYNSLEAPSADSIYNCTYAYSSPDSDTNKTIFTKYKSKVGFLTIAEFLYMGGAIKNADGFGLYGFSMDEFEASYRNNTMFRYNNGVFYLGDYAYVERLSESNSATHYDATILAVSTLATSKYYNNTSSLRPVVVINGTIKFSGGDGTKSNPYIIEVD